MIGYANSEWTGIAPLLEEDIAFSSLAQDELGHAKLFYELAAELVSSDPDALAYGRAPEGFRNAQICERPRGDWAYTVSRQFFYDTADYLRLESLQQSKRAALWLVLGAVFATLGLIAVVDTIIALFGEVMPIWGAAALTALILIGTGVALLMVGMRRLRTKGPRPMQVASEILKEDAKWVKKHLS